MGENISIGMTLEALLVRDVDTSEDKSPPAYQLMKIKSLPNSQCTITLQTVHCVGEFSPCSHGNQDLGQNLVREGEPP
jgi:hypothetical protein